MEQHTDHLAFLTPSNRAKTVAHFSRAIELTVLAGRASARGDKKLYDEHLSSVHKQNIGAMRAVLPELQGANHLRCVRTIENLQQTLAAGIKS